MLCLTCHHPCRENLPHPLLHSLRHINKHTLHVPSHQSASTEVTRQVAANKALRGQLQEKEDKHCQLQDKLVSHFFLINNTSLSLYLCRTALQYSSYFPFLFLLSYISLSLPLHLPASLHVCTFCSSLICSVWFHHVAGLCLLHHTYACFPRIICQIMHVLMSEWIKTTGEISVYAHVFIWVFCVSNIVVFFMWVADVDADQSNVLIDLPQEEPFWPMTLKPTQYHQVLVNYIVHLL